MSPYSGTVEANGTQLYYERIGSGPPAVFIPGSTGDAGHFSRTAALLADEFTVVTYDRRGNSRSPRPEGWRSTSVTEQADDAAALIRALGLEAVCLFAASAGGLIGLDLAMRYQGLLRGVVLQEPSLFSILPNAAELLAPRRRLVEQTLQAHGERAAVRAVLQYLNTEAVLEVVPPQVLERMEGNGEVIFQFETAFTAWRPSGDALRRIGVPIVLMVARETRPEYVALMRALEAQMGLRAVTVPGPHGFYLYRPGDLAEAVRPHFRAFLQTQRNGV